MSKKITKVTMENWNLKCTWVESVECTYVVALLQWPVIQTMPEVVDSSYTVASHVHLVTTYKCTVKILNPASAPGFPEKFIVHHLAI